MPSVQDPTQAHQADAEHLRAAGDASHGQRGGTVAVQEDVDEEAEDGHQGCELEECAAARLG